MIECKICGSSFKFITNTHLKKHGITAQEYLSQYGGPIISEETRQRMQRDDGIAWDSIPLGKESDTTIAERLGVSRRKVCAERNKRHIPLFEAYLLMQEGYPCVSKYEAMYDAILHWQNIPHKHQVPVTGTRYRADFWVSGRYVEVVGMLSVPTYREQYERKCTAYDAIGIAVDWLFSTDVVNLYSGCPLPLKSSPTAICKNCGKNTYDRVKDLCRQCYMIQWRKEHGEFHLCEYCGRQFSSTNDKARFCCHEHYANSLRGNWPSWQWLSDEMEKKPVYQIALDIGKKPSSLYMHIRRRRIRNAGCLL